MDFLGEDLTEVFKVYLEFEDDGFSLYAYFIHPDTKLEYYAYGDYFGTYINSVDNKAKGCLSDFATQVKLKLSHIICDLETSKIPFEDLAEIQNITGLSLSHVASFAQSSNSYQVLLNKCEDFLFSRRKLMGFIDEGSD